MKTILVTGATGTIGSRTVDRLASDSTITVRAAVHARRPPTTSANVEQVGVDIEDPESLRAAASGVDAVFMITPPEPADQRALARSMLEGLKGANVPRVVKQSAILADREDAPLFVQVHRDIEKLVVDSGIPHTFLRCNSYMTNFATFDAPDAQGNIFKPWGDGAISLIDPRDVAAVAAHVLTTAGHDGKAYTLTGPAAVSGSDIASAISDVTGRSIRYVDVPEEAARQGMLEAGMPPDMVDAVLDWYAATKSGRTRVVTDTVRELIGRPSTTFMDFARDHVDAWKPRSS